MFQGGIGSGYVYSKPAMGSGDFPCVQFNAHVRDVYELVFTFQAAGKFPWSFLGPQNLDAVFLTENNYTCSAPANDAETHCQFCLVRVNVAGYISFSAMPIMVTNLRSMSNVMLVARRIGRAALDPPASAPWYDPSNWAQSVDTLKGRTQKWVTGYKVKYAVSFYTEGEESVKGPWSDWIQESWALPTLINIPVGPSYVEGRKIYRQFNGFPGELVVTLSNNTDTRCPDDNL